MTVPHTHASPSLSVLLLWTLQFYSFAHLPLWHNGGVVECELLDGITHGLEVLPFSRVQASEDHRLRGFEARQRLDRLALAVERIAHARFLFLFSVQDMIAM